MKEQTTEMLTTNIIGICFKKACTIEEITNKIYKNNYAKNIVRVYQNCELLMKHGVIVPKFQHCTLRFQVDQEMLLK